MRWKTRERGGESLLDEEMTMTAEHDRFKLSKKTIRIAPSLLAADFSRLREEVERVEAGGADLLHLDVMDGHFVPNISFGPGLIEWLRPHSKLFFDAHLMIEEPARYAEAFAKAGCDHITFHIEVASEPREVIDVLRGLGVSVGVCINPTTSVSRIESIVGDVDMVLVMSVWPGFGGQAFIPDVLENVRAIRGMLREDQRLEIDGGIDLSTIGAAVEAGVDTFVAGSAIFRQDDPVEAMDGLRVAAGNSATRTISDAEQK
jgi:ribulose-phosphate 3-epimerase